MSVIQPAPFIRLLAAALYDTLLVIALWFLIGFASLPFTHGEAIPARHLGFSALLFGATAAFFLYFWTHGGQTLGMRAWRLQLRREDGGPVNTTRAALRLALAVPSWCICGLGVFAMFLDARRRTLHDRLSGTEVILAPAPAPGTRPR